MWQKQGRGSKNASRVVLLGKQQFQGRRKKKNVYGFLGMGFSHWYQGVAECVVNCVQGNDADAVSKEKEGKKKGVEACKFPFAG